MNYTFEQFLAERHAELHPTILDDDLIEAFDDWLAELTSDEWIVLAEKYAIESQKRILSELSTRLEASDVGCV